MTWVDWHGFGSATKEWNKSHWLVAQWHHSGYETWVQNPEWGKRLAEYKDQTWREQTFFGVKELKAAVRSRRTASCKHNSLSYPHDSEWHIRRPFWLNTALLSHWQCEKRKALRMLKHGQTKRNLEAFSGHAWMVLSSTRARTDKRHQEQHEELVIYITEKKVCVHCQICRLGSGSKRRQEGENHYFGSWSLSECLTNICA